jgi:hypothetical protein
MRTVKSGASSARTPRRYRDCWDGGLRGVLECGRCSAAFGCDVRMEEDMRTAEKRRTGALLGGHRTVEGWRTPYGSDCQRWL